MNHVVGEADEADGREHRECDLLGAKLRLLEWAIVDDRVDYQTGEREGRHDVGPKDERAADILLRHCLGPTTHVSSCVLDFSGKREHKGSVSKSYIYPSTC